VRERCKRLQIIRLDLKGTSFPITDMKTYRQFLFLLIVLGILIANARIVLALKITHNGLHQTSETSSSGEVIPIEISRATYGLLRRFSQKADLQEIDNMLCENLTSGKDVFTAIKETANAYGVSIQQLNLPKPELIIVPSLLIVSNTGKPGQDGVLLLVEGVASNQLQIYDFRSGKGRGYIHFADLALFWNGDSIVAQRDINLNNGHHYFLWFLVSIIGISLMFVSGALVWPQLDSIKNWFGFFFICLLITASGCDRSKLDNPKVGSSEVGSILTEENLFRNYQSPLRSAQGAILDLGVLGKEGSVAEFSVPVTVIHPKAIKVNRILGNCSCLEVGTDVVGKEFSSAETFEIAGKISLDGIVGEDLLILQIFTGEGGMELPVFKFGIRFTVYPTPRVHVNSIALSGYEKDESLTGEINIFMVRRKSDPLLKFDIINSQLNDFQVEVKNQEITSIEGSDLLRDTLNLSIGLLKERESGKSNDRLILRFIETEKVIDLPVTTSVLSEFIVRPPSLFLGLIKAGTPISKEIEISHHDQNLSLTENISLADQSDTSWVKITHVSTSNGSIKVGLEFETGLEAGRKEKEVTLKLENHGLISIPTSWVILP
jgi:hypothetical protein